MHTLGIPRATLDTESEQIRSGAVSQVIRGFLAGRDEDDNTLSERAGAVSCGRYSIARQNGGLSRFRLSHFFAHFLSILTRTREQSNGEKKARVQKECRLAGTGAEVLG